MCVWDDGSRDDRPEDGGDTKKQCKRDGGNWVTDTDTTITVNANDGSGSCQGNCPEAPPLDYFANYYIQLKRKQLSANDYVSHYPDYKGFFCAGFGLKNSWPNLAIDSIGLIPEVEGGSALVRKIGNFKGYRGIVADNYGKGVIKAVNAGVENAHTAERGANLGRGIGESDAFGVGLTLAGFVPGLGQGAATLEMAKDWNTGMKESPECH